MKKFALIAEGKGDVKAAPSLIAKAAAAFGVSLIPCEPVIRAGEAKKLKRIGELEKYLHLAASREEVDEIFLVLDLDDGCAKEFADEFNSRAAVVRTIIQKPIHVCFLVREFEALFLSDLSTLCVALPEYGIPAGSEIGAPETIRPAKERLSDICKTKGYKQIRDQLEFTKKLNVYRVAMKNRSFRKILKAVTAKTYTEIMDTCRAKVNERRECTR